MATPTILDFYRFAAPRGTSIKKTGVWTTSSSPNIVVTAAAGKTYFIQGISLLLQNCTDLGANALNITHSSDQFGGVKNTTIQYGSVEAILCGFAPGTERIVAKSYFGFILFDVPSKLSAASTLTISYTGGTGGITTGFAKFGVTGWYINTVDL